MLLCQQQYPVEYIQIGINEKTKTNFTEQKG